MRITAGKARRRRRKRILKEAKGFRNGRKNLFKQCKQSVMISHKDAFRDRRKKKGNMRKLWISRINAAIRSIDPKYSYSRFICDLKNAQIEVNRKLLADIAVRNEEEFGKIVEIARSNS